MLEFRVDRLSWLILILCALLASPAMATPVRFGFTGVHELDEDVWSGMNDEARRLFLEGRVDLAKQMGGSILRMGATKPQLVDMESIHAGNQRKWTAADAAVMALTSSGLDLCLTLPELVESSGLSAYQEYLSRLAERYDGDTDFGIDPADVNYEFPDIDGSGALTVADWEASDAAIATWAEAHRVMRIESGHEPRALEMTGQLAEDAYAAQLKVARASLNASESEHDLVLAGVRVDDQSKSHFVNRFQPMSSATAPWFDLAVAHLFESVADISQQESATHLSKFGNWLESIDHGAVPRWLGELALPSSADASSESPFIDPRTSERTQSNGLVRLTTEALLEGFEAVLYAVPIETESAGDNGARAGTGLLKMTEIPGLEPMQWPYEARPVYGTWRWLVDRFDGVDGTDITRMSGLPVNAKGARVSGQGWLLWYDWFVEVAPEADYEGALKPVTLNGIPAPSVLVTTLWPEEVDSKVDENGDVEVSWTQELMAVEGGSVTIFMGRDPVWVEESDETVAGEDPADGGGASQQDASTADDTASDSPTPSASSDGSSGGCSGGATQGPLGLVVLLLLALRRRRTGALST
jgi:MYXO-CTERM domain-containing protein